MLLRHRIVDMHSHLGVNSVPKLGGARDLNSHKGCFFVESYFGTGLTIYRTNLAVAPQPGWAQHTR